MKKAYLLKILLLFVVAITFTAPVCAQDDLTTNTATGGGSMTQARYLVNLGFDGGQSVTAYLEESGLYDYAKYRGNQSAWWVINDGSTDAVAVTYGDINQGGTTPPPDFFGYKFKYPVSVTSIKYIDYCFGDGGTFNGAPSLQYLPSLGGTWTTADATWDNSYDSSFVGGRRLTYNITPNIPLNNIWGIRLYGDTTPSGAWDSSGWASVTELTVYGRPNFGAFINFDTNLAQTGTPICSNNAWLSGTGNEIIDNDFNNSSEVWDSSQPSGDKFVGISWSTPQHSVGAIGFGMTFNTDGGWFVDTVGNPLKVQYTKDGSTWHDVENLNKGRYTADYSSAASLGYVYKGSWLFTFKGISDITGIRLIGLPGGSASGLGGNGYVSLRELQIFKVSEFIDQTGMPLSTVIVSNPITVTDISGSTAISIAGDNGSMYQINGGTWRSDNTTVSPNDIVMVRVTSSSNYETTTHASITIGGISDNFTVTTAAAGDPNATGLVSWWKGDNNTLDSIGGNHGTAMNGVSFALGKINQAFSFDGSDDYVTFGSMFLFHQATDATLEFWVKRGASASNSLFWTRGDGSDTNRFNIGINPPDTFYFDYRTPSGDLHSLVSTNLPFDIWTHIAVTRTGDTYVLYKNGVFIMQATDASPNLPTATTWSMSGRPGYIFDGLLDEVKLFNRALSALDIAILTGTKPDAFSFIDQTDAPLGTPVESNSITVTGISNPAPISISGGQYAVSTDGGLNWTDWTGTAGTVDLDSLVKVLLTSSSAYDTIAEATLTIGGVSDTFSVTTVGTGLVPIPLTNLRIWLTSDAGIAKNSSNLVSIWADQSGNGFDVAQGDAAKQPLFVDNATGNKPALRFDGGDDYLQTASAVNLLEGIDNFTLIVAVKPGTTQRLYADIIDYTHGTNINTVLQQEGSNTNRFGAPGNLFQSLSPDAYQVLTCVYINAIPSAALYLNGGNQLQATGFAQTSLSEPNYFTVGSKSVEAYSRQFNGDIVEVIVYNAAISDTKRQSIESYLIGKYGIDMTPDAFSFTDQTGMPLSTQIISNPVNITGIDYTAPVSITGGEYAISTDGGSTWGGWASDNGTVQLNNQVKVRLTSASSYDNTTSATLAIGGVSDTFSVTTAAAGDPNTSGLVAWWRAENNALDSVGGNHGTLQGDTTFASGTTNQAFSFDGDGDYVQIPNFINGLTAFSFSFWMNISSFTDNAYMAPICQGADSNIAFCFYVGDSADAFGFQGGWRDGGYFDLRKTLAVGTGVWKHIAVTYDGATLTQYVGGILDNQQSHAGKTLGNTEPFFIGKGIAYPGSPITTYFDGLVDEVQIFSRALSTLEVSALAGTKPDAFHFTDQTGVALSTLIESDNITVTGISYPASISIAGGDSQYAIFADNGSTVVDWTSAAGTVAPNRRVKVRLTSPASFSTTDNTTLTIGGVSDTFSVTTGPALTTTTSITVSTTTIAVSTTTVAPATTTTAASSTTTTTKSKCPFVKKGGGTAQVQNLRQLRDHLLDTTLGALLAAMYYQNMDEIGDILEQDAELSVRFTQIMSDNMPAVRELMTQGNATMQSAEIVKVHDFLVDLQAQAGPKLRMDIDFILRAMESGWLLGWSGIRVE